MKILLITGDHPRHKFLVREIANLGIELAWVIEQRENFVPIPPPSLDNAILNMYTHHFLERERVENLYFGQASNFDSTPKSPPILTVDREGLNSRVVYDYVLSFKPDLVLSYGCHMLGPGILGIPETAKWNIHGGLSPYYRCLLYTSDAADE